ncbi:very-short-patch-repair endonuclease [Curtobacterium pusillum]|uniref:Very-short-patch-repair endonuclease n=1 Tax=Curtobacterium pusillum TaxID=69373 RepID=A0AAW3T6X5_9MICO|nr:hypothetical protein [Curtobacterium pusillum]MBA8990222.1 very-short-patch-repair endonuclease [Curtobacterium pusillum]
MSRAHDVELIRTAGLPDAERRALERRVHRGSLERIRPGVLVRRGTLAGLFPAERHLVLARASLTRLRGADIISHESACAVLELPLVGRWPPKVHISDPTTAHGRVTAWFVRHGVEPRPPLAALERGGLPVTNAARTAVDVAASRPLLSAVPVIDHVLRAAMATTSDLDGELGRLRKGQSKAAIAVRMGSALSESPAESVCRVRFRQLGVPEPVQQHAFHRPGERTAIVDFWFPEQGVVVEVDGRAKYEDPAMLDDRTTADAHWREKQREDFMRSFSEVRAVVRLTWADLMDPDRVRVKLVRAGIPCR